MISFGKIIPKKEEVINNLNIFKKKIELFNKEINDIINDLVKVKVNFKILYQLLENIIKMNYFKNYEMIQNLNDINIYKYIKDIGKIIEEKYLNKKFEKIIKIYTNLINKNINEYLDNNEIILNFQNSKKKTKKFYQNNQPN